MRNSSFRIVAWPLLICLVVSLIGADVLHYRLCHHPAGETSQPVRCTLHSHADGVVHTHAHRHTHAHPHVADEPVPDSMPGDSSQEDCLVCQVLSNDAPQITLVSGLEQTGLVAELTLQEPCQDAGKPLRRSLSRGPPRVSIAL